MAFVGLRPGGWTSEARRSDIRRHLDCWLATRRRRGGVNRIEASLFTLLARDSTVQARPLIGQKLGLRLAVGEESEKENSWPATRIICEWSTDSRR